MSDTMISQDPRDSLGPARPVPGASPGGTLRILRDGDYDTLDPQCIGTLQGIALSRLLYRTLTTIAEDGAGGWQVVGDLATGPGRDVHGDGRTWEFTLKPGLRYEDGREVRAGDVAHGIARSFEAALSEGPAVLRGWLGEGGDYAGPFTHPDRPVPGVRTPDDRTLVLTFRTPRPELPFAASLVTTVPVPPDRDSAAGGAPPATGPYRIAAHLPGQRLELERNPHWQPETDAVRHAYPDRVVAEFGVDAGEQMGRARAGLGDDAFALAENNAPASMAAELLADPALRGRLRNTATPLVWYLVINTARVSDIAVRRAIATAVDRCAVRDAMLGPAQGALVHTLLTPSTAGYRAYADPHAAGPHGDPERARALLAGARPKLRMLTRDDPYFAEPSRVLARSLERAGFTIDVVGIDRPSHNAVVQTRDSDHDLSMMCLAGDWPGASTLLTGFDGRTIKATGNDNFSYLDDPGVNDEIARLATLPAQEAAGEWSALDERLMTDHVPFVPLYSYVHVSVNGPRVGGVFTSAYLGTPLYCDAFLRGADGGAAPAPEPGRGA